jgi:hypothetical protein
MSFAFAEITSISPDTGDNDEGLDSNDFITNASNLQFQGVAVGTGTLGVNLVFHTAQGDFAVPVGSVNITSPGLFNFNLSNFTIPDGIYSLQLTDGVGGPVVTGSSNIPPLVIDNQAPTLTVNAVGTGNVLSEAQADNGLLVTGTATTATEFQNLVNGESVVVDIRDAFNNVLFSQDATVVNGTWSTTFDQAIAETLTNNGIDNYSITASLVDEAGNTANTQEQFTSTICFMPGTKIRTPDGEANVETLKRGDLVITTDGRVEPVAWVGRQTVSKVFADPVRVWPIRIKAGALAENVPCRDLLLSPDHAILVDGVLIQAGALVNGSSITRESHIPMTFTYYHVELVDHSLILAENVPAETFVDNINRLAFDNWDEHQALYPEGQAIEEMPYPRALSFRQVPQATRARLLERGAQLFGGEAAAPTAA